VARTILDQPLIFGALVRKQTTSTTNNNNNDDDDDDVMINHSIQFNSIQFNCIHNYKTGCIFYMMVVGRLPFEAMSNPEIIEVITLMMMMTSDNDFR
jgi:hypothetical protein